MILQGEKITRIFHQGKTEIKVLDGIDIKIFEKDFTVIMGPSGAGKSTLLYMLGGMDHITGGCVLYRDKEISSFSEKRMGRKQKTDCHPRYTGVRHKGQLSPEL